MSGKCVCVCMCVCVRARARERERERERERVKTGNRKNSKDFFFHVYEMTDVADTPVLFDTASYPRTIL